MKTLLRFVALSAIGAAVIAVIAFSQGRQDQGVWGFDQAQRLLVVTSDFTTAAVRSSRLPD
jgi:hypothetical protein